MQTAEQFWARVDKSGACWKWQGAVGGRGYGSISWRGRSVISSRLAWELTSGPIPDGLYVCHRCDNRLCVRPDHLFLATQAENMADMARKGRANRPRGERSGRARLTAADVREIKARLERGETQVGVAAAFGVSSAHVSRISRGLRWPGGCEEAA